MRKHKQRNCKNTTIHFAVLTVLNQCLAMEDSSDLDQVQQKLQELLLYILLSPSQMRHQRKSLYSRRELTAQADIAGDGEEETPHVHRTAS